MVKYTGSSLRLLAFYLWPGTYRDLSIPLFFHLQNRNNNGTSPRVILSLIEIKDVRSA